MSSLQTPRQRWLLGTSVAALAYLDSVCALPLFARHCEMLQEDKQRRTVWTFMLQLEVDQLAACAPELAQLVLHHSRLARSVFARILELAATTLHSASLPPDVPLRVILQLSSLPQLPAYDLAAQRTTTALEPHYFYIRALVTTLSCPMKYTQCAKFVCRTLACPAKGVSRVRLHVSGSGELETVNQSFNCDVCQRALQEEMGRRQLGEQVRAGVAVLLETTNCSLVHKRCGRTLPMTAIIRDDLIPLVELGGRYLLIGLPLHNSEESVQLDVCNVVSLPSLQPVSTEKVDYLTAMARQAGVWQYLGVLTSHFAARLSPPGTFFSCKLCLLASLAQTNSQPLHVLLCGEETTFLSSLLQYSARFAEISVHHSGSLVTTKSSHATGELSQVGSLEAAAGGVCVIGSLDSLKKSELDRLKLALTSDSGTCGTTVWTSDVAAAIQESRTCIHDTFQLAICTDESSDDDDLALLLADHVINESLDYWPDEPEVCEEDFRQLLNYARLSTVEFDGEAEDLLRGYFLHVREQRGAAAALLTTLLSLAEGLTRLTCSDCVSLEHATTAALLMEEILAWRHGYSQLGISPQPHLQCDWEAAAARFADFSLRLNHVSSACLRKSEGEFAAEL